MRPEGPRFWGASQHFLTRALGHCGGWSGLGRWSGQRGGRAVPAGSSELGLRLLLSIDCESQGLCRTQPGGVCARSLLTESAEH